MADLSKIKQSGRTKNRFGDLPSPSEKSETLAAPETAPAPASRPKSIRTKRWGTTVAPDFPKRMKLVCAHLDISQVELLERWLAEEESRLK